jgi:hypothetical protein
MAVTLLWLLNTHRVPAAWRNKAGTNALLALCALAFAALAVDQVRSALSGVF